MNCEIEFMPVGESSRAGDAIVVRYGELHDYKIMLIDGGTSATGEEIVLHLRKFFGADVEIEHMVLTHSDGDHASGLREVLKAIPVKNVWMHVPWLLAREVVHLFSDKRWTADGLERNIKEKYDILAEIVDLALEAGGTSGNIAPSRGRNW
jgi:glyoxylase-like metal-dependent hydrolase (beta-lactamase superfamily II)